MIKREERELIHSMTTRQLAREIKLIKAELKEMRTRSGQGWTLYLGEPIGPMIWHSQEYLHWLEHEYQDKKKMSPRPSKSPKKTIKKAPKGTKKGR